MLRKGKKTTLERFIEKVEIVGECWLWRAAKLPRGYGRFLYDGKPRYAHRAAMAMFNGADINSELETLHSCDTPQCVNPSHLSYGTHTENMQDASRKGRARTTPKSGAENNNAKLSDDQVSEIIRRVVSGELYPDLADEFAVSGARIGQIARGAGVGHSMTATQVREKRKAQRLIGVAA